VPVQLNHTIVAAYAAEASARWVAEMLGVDGPEHVGPFWQVTTANGVGLDFASVRDITPQHYAFLIGEDDFDGVYTRLRERGLEHWADPMQRRPGEINHRDGGRGVYFLSPDGHFLEVLTRPYGSG
jgi:extradiol dioxygenase family protein